MTSSLQFGPTHFTRVMGPLCRAEPLPGRSVVSTRVVADVTCQKCRNLMTDCPICKGTALIRCSDGVSRSCKVCRGRGIQ